MQLFGRKVQLSAMKQRELMPSIWYSQSRHCYIFCCCRFCVAGSVAESDRKVTVKTWGYAVRRSGIYKRKIAVKPWFYNDYLWVWRLNWLAFWSPIEAFQRKERLMNLLRNVLCHNCIHSPIFFCSRIVARREYFESTHKYCFDNTRLCCFGFKSTPKTNDHQIPWFYNRYRHPWLHFQCTVQAPIYIRGLAPCTDCPWR